MRQLNELIDRAIKAMSDDPDPRWLYVAFFLRDMKYWDKERAAGIARMYFLPTTDETD